MFSLNRSKDPKLRGEFAAGPTPFTPLALLPPPPAWRWLGRAAAFAVLLQFGNTAQAATEVCGEPGGASQTAMLVWKNCSSGAWTMRAGAAPGASTVSFRGDITSNRDATYVFNSKFEGGDVLNSGNTRDMSFTMNVANGGVDEVTFAYPSGADVCLGLDSPGTSIMVGPNKTQVSTPVDLSTMGPCGGGSSGGSLTCGTLYYQPATQKGAFLWQDCGTNRWHLRIAGGGGSGANYTGSITSDQAVSGIARVSLESNDVVNTSQWNQVKFNLTVGGIYEDGIDFTLNSGATTCIDTGTTTAVVGPNRINVQSPFNPSTLTPCGDTVAGPSDGGGSGGDGGSSSGGDTTTSNGVTYRTVTPGKLSSLIDLPNPGKGFEQAGTILNNGQFNYHTAVESYTDITYIRLPWANLEPNGDNRWNWNDLDRAINDVVRRGKQAAISVISWKPILDTYNYQEAVPAWYSSNPRHVRCTGVGSPSGCTYYLVDAGVSCQGNGATCRNRWAFNHDDPVFINQQVELINALRQRYDNKQWAEKIAYMDVRSIGSWSESHTTSITLVGSSQRWPMPKWSNYQRIIDAHLAFKYIPQVVNFDNDDNYREQDGTHPWDYACRMAEQGGQTIGWRSDGIEVTEWEINKVWEWSDAARNCWKNGPVYAEPMDGMGLQSGDLVDGLNRLIDWHASGWNNKYSRDVPNGSWYTGLVEDWMTEAGYRLYVERATIPSAAPAGRSFNVSVDLANEGIAPLYRNFYDLKMRFHPSGGGNDVVVTLQGELRKVLPGEGQKTFSASASLSAGNYEVSVGIIEDAEFGNSFPVKLAQQSSTCSKISGSWWCEIGSTTVR